MKETTGGLSRLFDELQIFVFPDLAKNISFLDGDYLACFK
jgi:hypothetical protein